MARSKAGAPEVRPASAASWGLLVLAAVVVVLLGLHVLTRDTGPSLVIVSNDVAQPSVVDICSSTACPERSLGTLGRGTEQAFLVARGRRLLVRPKGLPDRCAARTPASGVVLRVSSLPSCASLGVITSARSTAAAGHRVRTSK